MRVGYPVAWALIRTGQYVKGAETPHGSLVAFMIAMERGDRSAVAHMIATAKRDNHDTTPAS